MGHFSRARDKRELATLDTFLSAYVIGPIHEGIGSKAYEFLKAYAKSHGLHVFDSLVTRNQRHFRMIAGLSLLVAEY